MFAPDPLHFVSGASAPADIRGLAEWSVPLGISLSELSRPALHTLRGYACMPLLRIFVDSGAFSETDRTGAVVCPISDTVWIERVRTMHLLAATFGPPAPAGNYGPRVYVVAPDRVGDQPETLRRLALHAEAMRACHALGAVVVVPIQRGAMTAATFDRAACETLGFDSFARGIPGNKIAMPYAELEAFLRERRPASVHLLGVGPNGKTYEPLTTLVRRVLGDVGMSCDSNTLAASVGRTNGPGGGPRRLTALQDAATNDSALKRIFSKKSPREMAVWMAFGPARLHQLVVNELRASGHIREERSPVQMDLFDKVSTLDT